MKKQDMILKALVFGYAQITLDSCKKHGEIWYEQCKQVNKYFSKKKGTAVKPHEKEWLDKKFKEVTKLDSEYFADRQHSSYACMIVILDYLIREREDLEMRNRFGHFGTTRITHELDTTSFIKDVSLDSQKYLFKVLELIK